MVRYTATDFGKRIVSYVQDGDIERISELLRIGIICPDTDIYTIQNTFYKLLESIVLKTPYNYKEMIDTILMYGLVDSSATGQTPLQNAIIARNFPVAAYLQYRGGTYSIEVIDKYNTIADINLYQELDREFAKL